MKYSPDAYLLHESGKFITYNVSACTITIFLYLRLKMLRYARQMKNNNMNLSRAQSGVV